ncbi:MAG TPA: acyl-CoA dehydrogenase [Acidimicrobiales bacterium]|nr:acyl-CoA dehydrogenase [Acidimicrobiales bacterium]
MSLAINDEHAALAASARRFLDSHCPPAIGRAALDGHGDELPPFWADASRLGWAGLHLDPDHGGEGYGIGELALIVEELGRAAAPGPFLATVVASALIAAGGGPEIRREWLPRLASGTAVATVAFPGVTPVSATRSGNALVLTGTLRPLLSAGLAEIIVVPAAVDATVRWCVVPAASGRIEPLASLDPARPVGAFRVDDVVIEPGDQLTLSPDLASALISALVAAECAGAAAWCVETASEYAKVRVQFGRPIGQFQAVKHRCADMLIALEQIRAAAWDAAAAMSWAGDGSESAEPERVLSGSIAAAVAPSLFVQIAKDCIQVLGGIGFTWEHDAHRYLRRALSLQALMGPPSRWRRATASLALTGVRRTGTGAAIGDEHEEVRARIRDEVSAIAARPKDERRSALVEAGLFVPHWAEPWGRSAGAIEQLIIDEELDRARVRRANMAVGAWAAPTIAAHGTPAQQERWVGPTLLGQIKWCQLFSEPGAGSDLASLTTRATRDDAGSGWRLNGQKVWTSMARDADFGICLARTNPTAPKHLGITYFIVDMTRAGIDIRPLKEMTGFEMFNEVFLNDVFVPDDHVIGQVDGGWALARTTLANERVAMGSGASFGGGMEALLGLVDTIGLDHLDPSDVDRLGLLLGESHCLSVMGRRTALRAVAGAGPGPESSVRKLLGAEHDQRTQEFGLAILGAEGATTEDAAGQWTFGFLANRCLTIAGGTSEVQRNVIGERLLGLPRDPET